MAEFSYAKGRIIESIQFISEELREFEQDYAGKTWQAVNMLKQRMDLVIRMITEILAKEAAVSP
jgi:hypothetical protein